MEDVPQRSPNERDAKSCMAHLARSLAHHTVEELSISFTAIIKGLFSDIEVPHRPAQNKDQAPEDEHGRDRGLLRERDRGVDRGEERVREGG